MNDTHICNCGEFDCVTCQAQDVVRTIAAESAAQARQASKFRAPRARKSVAVVASDRDAARFRLGRCVAHQEVGCKVCHAVREVIPDMPPQEKLAGIQDNLFDGPTEPGRMTTAEAAERFMTAGAAVFTIRSAKTGVRYTYKVTAVPDQLDTRWGKKFFVALLTGPDNTGDFTYLGLLEGRNFRLTTKSRMPVTAAPVKAITYAVLQIMGLKRIPELLEIWHEGRCGRCNRVLTVPESIALGLGPECAGKVGL